MKLQEVTSNFVILGVSGNQGAFLDKTTPGDFADETVFQCPVRVVKKPFVDKLIQMNTNKFWC